MLFVEESKLRHKLYYVLHCLLARDVLCNGETKRKPEHVRIEKKTKQRWSHNQLVKIGTYQR